MRSMLRLSLVSGAVFFLGCQSTTDPAGLRPGAPSLAAASKAAQATGSGQITYLDEQRVFAFNAQRSADGTVSGQVEIQNRAQDRKSHSEVVCVGVVGNTAFIGAHVLTSDDPSVVGQYGILAVTDNGEGANAPPDQVTLLELGYPLSTVQQYCTGVFGIAFPQFPVEGGNVQVH